MSAFIQGLKFGALTGLLNNMFGNCCCSFNPITSWRFTPQFFTPTFGVGLFNSYHNLDYNLPTFYNFSPPASIFPQQNYAWESFMPQPLNFYNTQNSWNGFGYFDTFTIKETVKPVVVNEPKIVEPEISSIINESNENNANNEGKKLLTTEERFEIYLKCILDREGGYANDKDDSGGETNYGITWKTYDAYRKSKKLPTQSVKKITMEEVHEIYYQNYFLASGADKIEDLTLGLHVFDTAVNCGVGTAKKMLIKSNNSIEEYENLRKEYYEKCVERNPKNKKFLKGWLNRIKLVKNYAKENLEVLA